MRRLVEMKNNNHNDTIVCNGSDCKQWQRNAPIQYTALHSNAIHNNTFIGRSIVPPSGLKNAPKVSLFSGFNDPIPSDKISLDAFITTSTYKPQVEEIRNCKNKEQRRKLKSQLPAITPSGLFLKRCNDGLLKHSGFICIDIDGKDNPDISDWDALKKSIADFEGLYYAGLSAGGNGLFLLFKLEYPEKHLEHFYALAQDLQDRGLVVDAACKDVSRLRCASYDPNPVYFPKAKHYTGLLSPGLPQPIATPEYSDKTASRVQQLVTLIESKGKNIADDYRDWYAIGRSLASEFGEGGRQWFHIISAQSKKYDGVECDKQYDNCLCTCKSTTIKTFFWYCRGYGLTTK